MIWLLGLVVLTVRPSALSSNPWALTVRSPPFVADRVAAVFEELWADRAPATWNTRRVAVQAFASWCGVRWLLASDLLAGVGPRRRRYTDNTRAVLYGDLEDLWRRRTVSLREKLLWRLLETAARSVGGVGSAPVEDIRSGPAAGPDPFEGGQSR